MITDKQKVVRDFKRGDLVTDIAARYGVTIGTVSVWARANGARMRQQGRRAKTVPSVRDLAIIRRYRHRLHGRPTLEDIGLAYGLTRAGVHRIWKKWKACKLRAPFAPENMVRFMGKDYKVIDPGVFDGVVLDMKTGQRTRISWQVGVHRAVLL